MGEPQTEVDYRDWIGNEERAVDTASPAPVAGLLATLDDDETQLVPGDALPPLWHWLYFLPQAPASGVGPDGHPKRGGFMPPVALPRRMFAGAELEFTAPITIGASLERRSEITDVAEKTGKSGTLVFVTVTHEIHADGTLAVTEKQNIVYREAGAAVPAPEARAEFPPAPAGAWIREVTPDPVLLFRFSALTFNGHRIHYDRSYATGEEGYPGLVVHGPLLATLLIDLVRRNCPRAVTAFRFRAMAPIFDTNPFRVIGTEDGNSVRLVAERADGAEAMRADATLARD